MSTEIPKASKRSYIRTFDTVRAIAVLLVFVAHSGITYLLPRDSKLHIISTSSLGHFGVILFFVLSGFLITRILMAAKGKKNAYKNFMIRRSLRIFPIYFLVILILLFIEPGRYL
ncbi:MAG: acyltransferase, partial [Phycisphaerales bacterium]|nr:acyltransferase [Phycisphaerales bacterium]